MVSSKGRCGMALHRHKGSTGCCWIYFAPFRAEHEIGQPFGSLWDKWVADLVAAAEGLRLRNPGLVMTPA